MCTTHADQLGTMPDALGFRDSRAFLRLESAAEGLGNGFTEAHQVAGVRGVGPNVEEQFGEVFRELFGISHEDESFVELAELVGEAAHRLGHLLRVASERAAQNR